MNYTPFVRRPLAVLTAGACAVFMALTPQMAQAAPAPVFSEFRATLLQLNEVTPPPFTGAFGSAKMTFHRVTRQLSFELQVTGIPSATAAHIHKGIVGVNGPIIFNLLGSGVLSPSAGVSGTIYLSPAQVDDLFAGNYYVNVHTAAFPGGELRGQLFPREASRTFGTQLTGDAEAPPVASAGSGSALVMLNDALDQFAFHLQVTGIPSATAAHIHQAPFGSPGPVVFDLQTLGGGTLNPATPISGSSPITSGQVATLLDGDYYVNVHTVANPGGELRGQLGPNELFLQAALSGANEVPPVATSASGLASFDLTQSIGKLNFDLEVTGIPSATAAHIHRAPAGVNGPIVFDLIAAGGGTLNPFTPVRGMLSLTATQVISLLTDGYYVNVHTVANPGGEIRGQIGAPQQFLTYQSKLNGANELPTPVTTTATAIASLVLDTLSNELTYKVITNSITTTVVGMHIHTGTITQTGGIAFGLNLSGTGVVTLTAEQVYRLNSGGYYINIHTMSFPAGEIRGQIYSVAIPQDYFAPMAGIGSTTATAASPLGPEVVSVITGLSSFMLDLSQTQLKYNLSTSGAVSVTSATINRGAPGVEGPVLYTLFSGSTIVSPTQPLTGTVNITPEGLNDLILNMTYVEVQTAPPLLFPLRGDITVARKVWAPLVARQ